MKLLLHSCCADCTIKFLESAKKNNIETDIYYYNPNIHPRSEYQSRLKAMQMVVEKYGVKIIIPDWKPSEYFEKINDKTWGKRCMDCWDLRIKNSVEYAIKNNYELFSSTLLSSEYQNNKEIKKIIEKYTKDKEIKIFEIEIDKKINTSGFYKQNFCGCTYSLTERMEEKYKS